MISKILKLFKFKKKKQKEYIVRLLEDDKYIFVGSEYTYSYFPVRNDPSLKDVLIGTQSYFNSNVFKQFLKSYTDSEYYCIVDYQQALKEYEIFHKKNI